MHSDSYYNYFILYYISPIKLLEATLVGVPLGGSPGLWNSSYFKFLLINLFSTFFLSGTMRHFRSDSNLFWFNLGISKISQGAIIGGWQSEIKTWLPHTKTHPCISLVLWDRCLRSWHDQRWTLALHTLTLQVSSPMVRSTTLVHALCGYSYTSSRHNHLVCLGRSQFLGRLLKRLWAAHSLCPCCGHTAHSAVPSVGVCVLFLYSCTHHGWFWSSEVKLVSNRAGR